MQREMSFRQYRAMDLIFFTAVLCLCEALIALAGRRWFPEELYTLSLTAAVTAIVMVRWGKWACIPAFFGAMAVCLASGARGGQYLIYGAGNLFSLLLLPLLGKGGWRRLRENVLLALGYGLAAALLMQLGRMLIALLMGNAPAICLGFVTTDVLSGFFSMLLVWIARRLDGMLEEQKHYLRRIQKEKENEKENQGLQGPI